MKYLKYVNHRLRYDSFPQLVLDILAKMGVYIQLFYIFLEGLYDKEARQWISLPEGYSIGFMKFDEMHLLAALPERNVSEIELKERLKEGMLCLGVKYNGKLAAFTWCNMKQSTFPGYRLSLKDDEAYLFDAHTTVSYRGKGIAPAVRYHLYLELAKIGKTKLYSFSDKYNAQAIRFKQKLNARIVGKGIYIRIFNKWHFRSPHSDLLPQEGREL